MPGIVVGVDGSDHSRRALGWAMREAAHHHVPLTVMGQGSGARSSAGAALLIRLERWAGCGNLQGRQPGGRC